MTKSYPHVPGARTDITDNFSVWVNGKTRLSAYLEHKNRKVQEKIDHLNSEFSRITEKKVKGRTYYYRWNTYQGKYESLGTQEAYDHEKARVKKEVLERKSIYKYFKKCVNSCVLESVGQHLIIKNSMLSLVSVSKQDLLKLSDVRRIIKNYPSGSCLARTSTDNGGSCND